QGGPCPLPYLASTYSPLAVPRDTPPIELRAALLDPASLVSLQAFLPRLPVPVVALPSVCARYPWWLAFLGHEVGHHVLHDLRPGGALVRPFKHRLRDAAQDAPEPKCDEAAAKRWKRWGEEIFADLFSVFALGPWAVWALVEMLRGEEASLLAESDPH